MQLRNRLVQSAIVFVDQYLGWRNWSVLTYNSVIENVFIFFYIALRKELFGLVFIVDFFTFFLFSIFSTTYGYLINDFADKRLDILHGKDNTFKDDSETKAILVVLLFFLLSAAFGMLFIRNSYFLGLWGSWAFIATFYSLKPIRLKERGKSGLVFVVIAQRVLPTLIIFAAFKYFDWVDVIFLTTYILFRGLSSDLNHQLEDYQGDARTGTHTYTVKAGLQKAEKLFRFSLEVEKGLLMVCLLIMYLGLLRVQVYGISVLLPLLLFYLLLYGLNWVQIRRHSENVDVNPFTYGKKNIFQFIHHAFPSVLLPIYLLLILSYQNWIFLFLLVFLMAYRRMYSLELITNSYPVQVIRKMKL